MRKFFRPSIPNVAVEKTEGPFEYIPHRSCKWVPNTNIFICQATDDTTIITHTHDKEEVIFVLMGIATVNVDGKEHILRATHSVTIPPNTKHGGNILAGTITTHILAE